MLCSSRLLTKASMKPRTLTLAETLAGAERAHKRVMRWPMWKRELSGIGTEGMMEKDDEKIMNDLRLLLTPLTVEGGSLTQIVSVLIGNLAYFFGLMFGTLSILQYFGIV